VSYKINEIKQFLFSAISLLNDEPTSSGEWQLILYDIDTAKDLVTVETDKAKIQEEKDGEE
jgi:hypothetical protein